MKRLLVSIIISICFLSVGNSQGEFKFNVKVVGKGSKPLNNIKVWLKNKNSSQVMARYTDYQGSVTFDVPPGLWSLNLKGLPEYDEILLRDNEYGSRSVTIPYDLRKIEDEEKIKNLRPTIDFSRIDQSGFRKTSPSKDSCIIYVILKDLNNKPVRNIPVQLVGIKHQLLLSRTTNSGGSAQFHVPTGERYAIDVDEIENFEFTQTVNREGIQKVTLQFQPTKIEELLRNDTIFQTLPPNPGPTTARTFSRIHIMDASGLPAVNENVFIQNIASNVVYSSKTDENGLVVFLLPNQQKYLIHFNYQRDVDVLNLIRIKGTNTHNFHIKYIPDPRLQYPENFIPKPDELFLKTFESFLTKQFPEPKEKVGLFLNFGNKVNAKSKEAVLEIGFSTTSDVSKTNKSDVNIAFVIDKSGSMEGYDRIESLKESMLKFVDKLAPSDNICLILFNDEAFKVIPLQKKGDGKNLKFVISEIEAGGFTNIYNGMVMGYEELLAHFDADKINKLVLLSDGYGETEPAIVINKSKEYNGMGLGLSAIGVGENYNYALLSLLAEESNGLMVHAGESKDIYPAFESQLSSLIYPIGRKAKLEIIYNKKIEFDQLYGFPVINNQQNKATIEIGDLYMGMNKLALAHFLLNKPDKSIQDMPVKLVFSYYDLDTKKDVEIVQHVHLKWEDETGEIPLMVDQQQKKLYAIAVMNQSIKVMAEAFAAENIDRAKNALVRANEQVKDIYPNAKDEDILELVGRMEDYAVSIDNYIRNNPGK